MKVFVIIGEYREDGEVFVVTDTPSDALAIAKRFGTIASRYMVALELPGCTHDGPEGVLEPIWHQETGLRRR